MALNAEISSPDANCYVTYAEADAYFADRMHNSNWLACTQQEQVLITASQMLDWYVLWKGSKASTTQSMEWPRIEVEDRLGNAIAIDIIPNDVKVAVYELALSSLEADRVANNDLAGLEQVKAGSLMIKAFPAGSKSTSAPVLPKHIWKILYDLCLNSNIRTVRLIRG